MKPYYQEKIRGDIRNHGPSPTHNEERKIAYSTIREISCDTLGFDDDRGMQNRLSLPTSKTALGFIACQKHRSRGPSTKMTWPQDPLDFNLNRTKIFLSLPRALPSFHEDKTRGFYSSVKGLSD